MIHGISDEEWISYLDGDLDADGRDRLEAHLIGCKRCWEFNERMLVSSSMLSAEGRSMRQNLALDDAALNSNLRSFFGRLRAESSVMGVEQAPEVRARLDSLKDVMTPMCGSTTAVRALMVAAQGSPAKSLERITEENWSPFLTTLKSIAVVMCGETGAHLVWESGQY